MSHAQPSYLSMLGIQTWTLKQSAKAENLMAAILKCVQPSQKAPTLSSDIISALLQNPLEKKKFFQQLRGA